jgi:hypothetical protein
MIPPERKIVVEKGGSLGCGSNLDEFETREEEPYYDCRKYFEKAFDPEVDNPPTSVLGGDKVAALTIH